MKARVKADSRITVVTAFGGLTFSRAVWGNVPNGCEEEARNHPYLEIDEVEADAIVYPVQELVALEPEPEEILVVSEIIPEPEEIIPILDEVHSEPEPEETAFEPLPVYQEEEKPKQPKVSKRVRRP